MAKNLDIKSALLKAGASAGGGIAAASLNKIDFVNKQKAVVRGLGKIIIGAFLPVFIKNKKHKELAEQAAAGFSAVGGIELANGIITKGGTENMDKAIKISGIGDINPNILGVGNIDATYIMDGDQEPASEYNDAPIHSSDNVS